MSEACVEVSAEVEFSDTITALYRLYDIEDDLLYVGITWRGLSVRLREHAESQPWWPEVARKTVQWYPDEYEACEAETAAIGAEQPRYNKRASSAPPVRGTGTRGCSLETHHELLARWDRSEFVEWELDEWRRKLTKEHPRPWREDGYVPVPWPPSGMSSLITRQDGFEVVRFRPSGSRAYRA